jgi:hypothetical protein
MKQLLLDDYAYERLISIVALGIRRDWQGDKEARLLHSQIVSLADDNAQYMQPNYPVPALTNIPTELCDFWPHKCNGLLGKCINCIWPDCEH